MSDFEGVVNGDNASLKQLFSFAAIARQESSVHRFLDTQQQSCSAAVPMPSNWDQGDLKFRNYWFVDDVSHGVQVEWRIDASCIGDNENIEQAKATFNNFDTDLSTRFLYITDEVTVTPSTGTDPNGLILVNLTRLNDLASGHAYSFGLRMEYGTT
jgi:hypothetical protein